MLHEREEWVGLVNYLIFLAKTTNQEIEHQQLVLLIWLPAFASRYSGLASHLTARNGKVGLYMCTAHNRLWLSLSLVGFCAKA